MEEWYKEFINTKYKPKNNDVKVLFYYDPLEGITSEDAIGRVASESSSGTWTTLTNLPKLLPKTKAYAYNYNKNYVKVAYPRLIFENGSIPAMMSGFGGNVFGMKAVKNLRLQDVEFPKNVLLNNVYFEDQQKDTLLYGEKIAVDISLFKLINNQLEIISIDLKGINTNIKRTKDSGFNFDYIIKAFASKEKSKDSKPWTISLSKVNLDKINFKYDDGITKNNIKIYFNHFDAKVDKFDVQKLYFEIPSINLDGLNMRLKQDLLVEKIVEKSKELTDPDLPNPLKLKLFLNL